MRCSRFFFFLLGYRCVKSGRKRIKKKETRVPFFFGIEFDRIRKASAFPFRPPSSRTKRDARDGGNAEPKINSGVGGVREGQKQKRKEKENEKERNSLCLQLH